MKDCMGFTTEDVVAILRSMKPPTMLRDGKSASHIMQTVAIEYAINAIEERKTAKRIDCIGHYKCSNCHTWVDDVDKYCPNCGAKMEVDE